jgi:hypothetical protein
LFENYEDRGNQFKKRFKIYNIFKKVNTTKNEATSKNLKGDKGYGHCGLIALFSFMPFLVRVVI